MKISSFKTIFNKSPLPSNDRRCYIGEINADVLHVILTYSDTASLHALCLASRFTNSHASLVLYRKISINSLNVFLLLRTVLQFPAYRSLIQHINIKIFKFKLSDTILYLDGPPLQAAIRSQNCDAQAALLLTRLPNLLSLDVQYEDCISAKFNSLGCDVRYTGCDTRAAIKTMSAGLRACSFNIIQRLSIQHCSLLQLGYILSLPNLKRLSISITEGNASQLSLPQGLNGIISLEIHIRDYLSLIVPALIKSSAALRRIRVVVTGIPSAAECAPIFYQAISTHKYSIQEVFYYNFHESYNYNHQETVFGTIAHCRQLSRLSTSIIPDTNVTNEAFWARFPTALQHLTLFDTNNMCPTIMERGGPIETLASNDAILPNLKSIELRTFLYGWEKGFWEHRGGKQETMRELLNVRGITISYRDWLDHLVK